MDRPVEVPARDPRELTPEECRQRLLDHIHGLVDYWTREARAGSVRDRLEGLAFSILAALDGAAPELPAFLLAPEPHPDNKAYRQAQGEDWWPENHAARVRGELGMLHEFFFERKDQP